MIRGLMVAGIIALTGCATPAGQIADVDFSWEQEVIAATPEEIQRRLLLGFRSCNVGVPECFLAADRAALLCDVYVAAAGARQSQFVMGRIRVESIADASSRVWAGLQPMYRRSWDKRIPSWLAFARGDATCRD